MSLKMPSPLLQISSLTVGFTTEGSSIRAVHDVSLSVFPGQTLAVVGESGCGKSVTALSILRLIPTPPGRIESGKISLEGRDLLTRTEKEMQQVRGREIAMIFQEPMTSLNPVFSIGDQIVEAVRLHQHVGMAKARQIAEQAMSDVGIADPHRRMDEYPHQMSGGMRQRVMIAMALSCQPKLLIADEPTTALDVTIQAQILELLRCLQKQTGMSLLLITHDLGVVAENADVVAVMYASRIVEYAPVEEVFDRPQHPYTAGLLRSVPRLGDPGARLESIPGMVPSPARFPSGCKFHPRCPLTRQLALQGGPTQTVSADGQQFPVMQTCVQREPDLREISPGHWAACHFAENFDRARPSVPQSEHRRQVSVDSLQQEPAR